MTCLYCTVTTILWFYKYSKAKVLKFDLPRYHEVVANAYETFVNQLRYQWKQVEYNGKNDNWWTNLFKSIEILILDQDSTFLLLSLLPIEILFDPIISHLAILQVDHCWNYHDEWRKYMNEFETKYLNFKNKLNEKGKDIRQLKSLKHDNDSCCVDEVINGPRFIESQHVCIFCSTIDCNDLMNTSTKCYPRLKTITFEADIKFNNVDNINSDTNAIVNQSQLLQYPEIETMRLLNCWSSVDICNNETLIESLNLHKSLKNLMLEMDTTQMAISNIRDDFKQWMKAIGHILEKQYYHNLENVNILLDTYTGEEFEFIDDFFKVLKQNQQLLKHQFRQFNIGIHTRDETRWS